LRFTSHLETSPTNKQENDIQNRFNKTMKNQAVKSCRICLGEENETENELISPCKCAGTMKYIHLKCLQEWLNGKKTMRELPFSSIYLFRISQCELCKENFPDYVRENGKRIEIFKLNKPTDGHFLVMEVLGMPSGRTFQVIKLSERHTLKIGRGHDSDVRVADISVSRCHALLQLDQEQNQVVLTDYHSKFGTLILIKKPTPLSKSLQKEQVFQVGRTMLTFQSATIKQPLIEKVCCCFIPKHKQNCGVRNRLGDDYEFFKCSECFPKELLRYKKVLLGESYNKYLNAVASSIVKQSGFDAEPGPEEESNHLYSEMSIQGYSFQRKLQTKRLKNSQVLPVRGLQLNFLNSEGNKPFLINNVKTFSHSPITLDLKQIPAQTIQTSRPTTQIVRLSQPQL